MADRIEQIEKVADEVETVAEKLGNYLVEGFQFVALFVIGGTIVWSAAHTYLDLVLQGRASVEDILLLFIYLELGAMVGIYFKTSRLPVQFLIYVAITVMTRSLASSLNLHDMPDIRMIAITGAILLLTVSVLILRYASYKFSTPYISHVEDDDSANSKRKPRLPND